MKAKEIPEGVELIYVGLHLIRSPCKNGGSDCAFKLKYAEDTYRFFPRDRDFIVRTRVIGM